MALTFLGLRITRSGVPKSWVVARLKLGCASGGWEHVHMRLHLCEWRMCSHLPLAWNHCLSCLPHCCHHHCWSTKPEKFGTADLDVMRHYRLKSFSSVPILYKCLTIVSALDLAVRFSPSFSSVFRIPIFTEGNVKFDLFFASLTRNH